MAEMQAHGVADGGDDLARTDRQQHAAQAAGDDAVGQIGEPVDDHDPHAEEMPLQRAALAGIAVKAEGDVGIAAERDGAGKSSQPKIGESP